MRWFHSGGIFAALSATTSELIVEGMQAARAAGAINSFDLNYRAKMWASTGGPERAQQAGLLRDIFGPLPFRKVTLSPSLLRWHDCTVVKLAQAIYESRSFGDLPILADALEDAGCDNEAVLTHCREQGGVHVPGCWLLDLLLQKA